MTLGAMTRVSRAWRARRLDSSMRRRWTDFVRSGSNTPLERGIVLTLASRRDRFPFLARTLAALLTQSRRAEQLLVWLDEGDRDHLPADVRRMEAYGVQFHECRERLGPYTKLIPTARLLGGSVLVSADDDMAYHSTWLEELITVHSSSPRDIIGHRGSLVTLNDSGQPDPYTSWPDAANPTSGPEVFLTGVGGVLYPPGAITALWDQPDLFRVLSPRNDDLWFYSMALISGIGKATVPSTRPDPLSWHGSQDLALWRSNVSQQANDQQFLKLFEHFNLGSYLS